MNLYVSRDGQTFGPYTVEQAHQYLNGGQLLTSDFALLEGSSEWKTLPEVLGILTHQTGLGVPASQTLGENQDQSVSTRQEPSSSRTEPKVKTTGRRSSSGKKSKKLKGLNQPQTIIVQPKKSIFSRIFSTILVFCFLLFLSIASIVGALFIMPDRVAPILRKFGVPVDEILSFSEGINKSEKTVAIQEPKNISEILLDENTGNLLKSSGIRISSVENEKGVRIISPADPEKSIQDLDLEILLVLNNHIVSLDLTDSRITDEGISTLLKFVNLKKLVLQGVEGITMEGIKRLQELNHLEYLNLIYLELDDSIIDLIIGMENMREVYLFQTGVSEDAINRLKTARPKILVNSG